MDNHRPFPKSYYMFNKPRGCVTARTDVRHKTVMDYFHSLGNPLLHPVGRLDKDTEGLLIITDDGQLNQRIAAPGGHISKTYEFCALGALTDASVKELESGIYFQNDSHKTAPCRITVTARTILEQVLPLLPSADSQRLAGNLPDQPVTAGLISITEGRRHHIKRLIRHAGGYVIALKRISIGCLTLDEHLKPGEYRPLTEEELEQLTCRTP